MFIVFEKPRLCTDVNHFGIFAYFVDIIYYAKFHLKWSKAWVWRMAVKRLTYSHRKTKYFPYTFCLALSRLHVKTSIIIVQSLQVSTKHELVDVVVDAYWRRGLSMYSCRQKLHVAERRHRQCHLGLVRRSGVKFICVKFIYGGTPSTYPALAFENVGSAHYII